MAFKFDETLFASVVSSLKNMSFLSAQSLIEIETNESLSVSGQKHLNSIRLCNFQANRICNMMDFLMDSDTDDAENRIENFEIEDILANLLDTFCRTISAYTPVTSKYTINLRNNTSILLDKSRFELIFLNLLYCCIKKRNSRKTSGLSLSVSVTENKDDVIFHIRDNGNNLNPKVIDDVFSMTRSKSKALMNASSDSLILMSLKVAYKSAFEMGAKLSYTPLKSGNRFDISIPKAPVRANIRVCSPKVYRHDGQLCREILASIILEENPEELFAVWKGIGS